MTLGNLRNCNVRNASTPVIPDNKLKHEYWEEIKERVVKLYNAIQILYVNLPFYVSFSCFRLKCKTVLAQSLHCIEVIVDLMIKQHILLTFKFKNPKPEITKMFIGFAYKYI